MNGKGIGPHNAMMLNLFADLAEAAWREPVYHVGSSLTSDTWRDVDVRVLIGLGDFINLFGAPAHRWGSPAWKAHMLAWSKFGEVLTGLPIDFQVEPLDEANKRYPTEPRNALGSNR